MNKRQTIWLVIFMAAGLGVACAQDNSAPPTDDQSAQQQPPYPAYGQGNLPSAINENPPLSGMDTPSLEPNAAPLSYLQPGATISESADSNAAVAAGARQYSSVTRALGNLTLRRLWSHYDLALDYEGGVGYYTLGSQKAKLLQQLDFTQKILWKRGQLELRDGFSYLPEGNFGASYGSLGLNLGMLSGGALPPSGNALGAFGLVPRIVNGSAAEVTEYLTPKSSVTAMGSYGFTHFYGNVATQSNANTSFIGTSETAAEGGYNRVLSSRTQIALVYEFEHFDFSVSSAAFNTHVFEGLYGHRLSGRMDLLAGAGPQVTISNTCLSLIIQINQPCLAVHDTKVGVTAVFRLRYRFPRTSLDLSFRRFQTSGSGFFAGAETNVASLSATRPLTRVWSAFADLGYAHNRRLQSLFTQQQSGVSAGTYQYGFAGAGVHRQFGHDFHGFASFQFNELAFDHSYCGSASLCNRVSNRQVFTIGVDWTPRPIRLD